MHVCFIETGFRSFFLLTAESPHKSPGLASPSPSSFGGREEGVRLQRLLRNSSPRRHIVTKESQICCILWSPPAKREFETN